MVGTRTVVISYHGPYTEAAIYVVGAFTSPPWEVRHLLSETDLQGVKFFISPPLEVPMGEWHYKFVMESGEWLCDDSEEIGRLDTA